MAERGKLISIATRLEIKQRCAEETIRKVAESMRLSKTTVHKYGNKNGTKPLNNAVAGR